MGDTRWPNVTAYIGAVQFTQYYGHNFPDAHCSVCDWHAPWDGWVIVAHARTHGQDVECVECAVATLNLGLPASCTTHGGPKRCPNCQASVYCYDSCDLKDLT